MQKNLVRESEKKRKKTKTKFTWKIIQWFSVSESKNCGNIWEGDADDTYDRIVLKSSSSRYIQITEGKTERDGDGDRLLLLSPTCRFNFLDHCPYLRYAAASADRPDRLMSQSVTRHVMFERNNMNVSFKLNSYTKKLWRKCISEL